MRASKGQAGCAEWHPLSVMQRRPLNSDSAWGVGTMAVEDGVCVRFEMNWIA